MKKVLFIDRDGTLILEPEDYQVDSLEKLEFYPGVFRYLGRIAEELDYELVIVTNQDGLGTDVYPEETYELVQDKMLRAFEKEGITFKEILMDRSFPEENLPTRKPNTGLMTTYMNGEYDLENSFVIGDRLTDMELAQNLGTKGIWINDGIELGNAELSVNQQQLKEGVALKTTSWKEIFEFLRLDDRTAKVSRKTKETNIDIEIDLDGRGKTDINTGIGFFDHMLEQIAKHGGVSLKIMVEGDLEIDEHHTIEDTGIALGEAFHEALGNKLGIERYGYSLPMDDCRAQVLLDFGGRNWLIWEAEFNREMVGLMPTEMFEHFFKSFSDGARANLNIKAEGRNEHHKIEAIFKAFARAIKMAVKRDVNNLQLPSTKGVL